MFKTIIFSEGITVCWKRAKTSNVKYSVYVDGVLSGSTEKTFYRIEKLKPDTEYRIEIKLLESDGAEKSFFADVFKTNVSKKYINVRNLENFEESAKLTVILQKALDSLKQDEVLYFPRGTYLTGALKIHSNSEIYLDKGAVLKGSEKAEDYIPKIKSRFEGIERDCYSSLLNMGELDSNGGFSCENVIIRGEGTICGGGNNLKISSIEREKTCPEYYTKEMQKLLTECEFPDTIFARKRGRLINISNSRNIVISGLTIKDGPAWNVHMIYSENVVTEGCKILTVGVWNGDGWDPDSSKNCYIFDCVFHTGDDFIAIKSGKNPEGNLINRPSENIYVFSCSCECGNGIAIGSEMSGGINGVYVWDCDFTNSSYGFQIKTTKKRGGYIKNVEVENSSFSRIIVEEISAYNNDGESAPTLPYAENLTFNNIKLSGKAVFFDGIFNNPAIEISDFGQAGSVKKVSFDEVRILNTRAKAEELIKITTKERCVVKNLAFDDDE